MFGLKAKLEEFLPEGSNISIKDNEIKIDKVNPLQFEEAIEKLIHRENRFQDSVKFQSNKALNIGFRG